MRSHQNLSDRFRNMVCQLVVIAMGVLSVMLVVPGIAIGQTKPLLGNSPDGSHSGSDHARNVVKATIESVKNNPDYTDAQKERMIDALKKNPDPTEVADSIKEGGLEITATDRKWGMIRLHGRLSTTEISGCWTDVTTVQMHIELYEKTSGKRGLLVGRRDRAQSAEVLLHQTGARCRNSDQGPMVTENDSCEIRVLGYRDDDAGGYTLMLEGSDRTHWTLRSGGEIGVASFMNAYFPYLNANAKTGGLGGLFISDQQIKTHQPLTFKGTVTGSGATTIGSVAVQFYPEHETLNPDQDVQIQEQTVNSMLLEFQKLQQEQRQQPLEPTPAKQKL